MNAIGRIVRAIWLNAGFYSGLLIMTAVSIVVVSVPGYVWLRYGRGCTTGEAVRRLIWHYGRAWTRLLMLFVPVRIEGCDKALPTPCIITPNHQSFFDTYCFAFMSEPDIVFAVRAWPFRMPFYGPYMHKAGYLNTENHSAETLLQQAKKLLAQGTSIAVFPEGTRSRDGSMRRFRSGAFWLASVANVPVVPLCIEGTGVFLRKGSFVLRYAPISIRVLAPVHPEAFAAYGDEAPRLLRRTVKARLEQALEEIRAQ